MNCYGGGICEPCEGGREGGDDDAAEEQLVECAGIGGRSVTEHLCNSNVEHDECVERLGQGGVVCMEVQAH